MRRRFKGDQYQTDSEYSNGHLSEHDKELKKYRVRKRLKNEFVYKGFNTENNDPKLLEVIAQALEDDDQNKEQVEQLDQLNQLDQTEQTVKIDKIEYEQMSESEDSELEEDQLNTGIRKLQDDIVEEICVPNQENLRKLISSLIGLFVGVLYFVLTNDGSMFVL